MLFKKKGTKIGFENEFEKELERFRKLSDAYELMVSEGGIPRDVLEEAYRYKEYAEDLFREAEDYDSAQNALTVLWDAYEIIESKKRAASHPSVISKQPQNNVKTLENIQCANCLNMYDISLERCPVCGVER